jgi:endo-1,4-beta-D-glucanase Y
MALRSVAARLDAFVGARKSPNLLSSARHDRVGSAFGASAPFTSSCRERHREGRLETALRKCRGALAAAWLALICGSAASWAEISPPPSAKPLILDSRVLPLGGALKASASIWQAYKARFLTEHGRLKDTGNGMISHSEGQGYAMLLAVAAGDRPTFDRLWGWTRANLMVRDDSLIAWRWQPDERPAVSDLNNATDGDLLIAWALTEAAEYWSDPSYRAAARRVAVEVGRKLVLTKTPMGMMLLPALNGFSAEDRPDGPVFNPSYWVFPAFARLPLVAPEVDWNGITEGGLNLIKAARFGHSGLPTNWVSARDGAAHPADGFAQQFGYDAIRIPLYLAWAGVGERDHFTAFVDWANRERARPAVVDVAADRDVQPFGETGYAAVGALTLCAVESTPVPADMRAIRVDENYYSVTLHLLALAATQMRYPSCLRG